MGRIVMASYSLKVASALVLVASCLGQDRGGGDSALAAPIRDVLRKANVSGSLAYWGQCGYHMSRLDFPQVRKVSNYSGPPREVLQRMFADDPRMRVTQEPGGKIRMVETDVPSDLLDVKISHLSLKPLILKPARESAQTPIDPHAALHWPGQTLGDPNFRFASWIKALGGPGIALELILNTSEVSAFKRANNIRPFSTAGFPLPGNSSSNLPVIGELDNVTVSQALDYVLETFPGFWVYENCPGEDGGRTVFFNFY